MKINKDSSIGDTGYSLKDIIWKKLGSISNVGSNNALDIPSTAKEIFVEVFPTDHYDGASIHILTSELNSNFKGYDGGFYKNSSDMIRILVYATITKIWVQEVVKNGNMYSTIAMCNIYYK